MNAPQSPSNSRFVIPIVAGVGNALLAVPMVRQIKRFLPNSRICVIARTSAMAEPFRRLGEVDEVQVSGRGLAGLVRMVRWTRRCRADCFLVPFPSNRWQYSMLALTSGARRKLLHGYPVAHLRSLGFIGERVPAVRGLHDVAQNLRLLGALGFQPEESEAPRFIVTDGDRARATRLLEGIGLTARTPFIVIHAGSAQTILAQAKRWPPQNYAELIRMIRGEFPHEVILLEGPDESGVAEEILAAFGGEKSGISVLQLTGPLGDAAAILERAAVYAGSDSGLAHLAAAVGIPAVTIFAPADPDRVCPFGNRHLVVQSEKSCSPCFQYPWQTPYPKMKCSPPFCVAEIGAPRVMDAIRRALKPAESLVPSPSGRGLG